MTPRNSSEYREPSYTEDYDDSSSEESTKFPREHEPDYNKRLMEWISQNNDSNGNEAFENIIKQKMVHTTHQAQTYQEKRDQRYREPYETYHSHHRNIYQITAPDTTIDASRDMIHENLLEAAEKNDLTYFQKILDSIPARDAELSEEIRRNTGFTTLPDAHTPSHDLEFKNTSQAAVYVQRMNHLAENYNTPEHFPNGDIRNAFQHQVESLNGRFATALNTDQRFEERQKSGAAHPWEKWNPAHLNDVIHVAQALNYITRPKDDLFWKIVDSEDERDSNLMIYHVVAERNRGTYQAIATLKRYNPESEEIAFAANGALTSVYEANIKSDVAQEDHESYLKRLEDMESRSEHFARVLNGQAGFIQSQVYEETPFPQWADQVSKYLELVSNQLQELDARGEIHQNHYKAVSLMIEKYRESSEIILKTPILSRDEDTERLINSQNNALRGIRFLMKADPNS